MAEVHWLKTTAIAAPLEEQIYTCHQKRIDKRWSTDYSKQILIELYAKNFCRSSCFQCFRFINTDFEIIFEDHR